MRCPKNVPFSSTFAATSYSISSQYNIWPIYQSISSLCWLHYAIFDTHISLNYSSTSNVTRQVRWGFKFNQAFAVRTLTVCLRFMRFGVYEWFKKMNTKVLWTLEVVGCGSHLPCVCVRVRGAGRSQVMSPNHRVIYIQVGTGGRVDHVW